MKKHFSDEQIIGILREAQAGGCLGTLPDKHTISDVTFYTWHKKFGGIELSKLSGSSYKYPRKSRQ